MENKKDKLIFILSGTIIGLIVGVFLAGIVGIAAYKIIKRGGQTSRYETRKEPAKKTVSRKAGSGKGFYISFENKSDLDVLKPSEVASSELSKSNVTHGKNSLMVKMSPGQSYPGIGWEAFGKDAQDWSGAKDFHFDVYNNTEDNIPLIVKFKSGTDYPKKSFSYSVSLEPLKMNNIVIPIESISGSCDLSRMSYIKIFVDSPQKEIVLFFDNIGTESGQKVAVDNSQSQDTSQGDEKVVFTASLKEGFDVFIASSMDRIFKDGKTLVKPHFSDSVNISMAANEYESFQIVLKNGRDPLRAAEVGVSDLINQETGAKIDWRNINWRVVGYVLTKKPYYTVKFVGLWPDPLMPAGRVDIEPGVTQPFWVTVYTPEKTPAGLYKGTIAVKAENTPALEIPFSVRVFDFTLPKESSLKTAFDFYPHITASRYPQKEKEEKGAYEARIADLNDQFIVNMLKHRMDPILNIDPQSQDDLRRVDNYRRYGLSNFAIGKKGGTFNNNWPKDDAEIEALLPLYRTYGENLKINKMLKYNYIYTWDESEMGNPQVAKIASMIHRAYPGLKNMVCYHGFWDPDKDPAWGKDIDIWCFGIGDFNEKKVKKLESIGMEMWTYISGPGSAGYPNLAIDFDSVDYRIVPWLCWRYDMKGFLYWCVNWWPYADPFVTAANTKWEQNGNGLMFYPGKEGPVDSLRAEIWRDGMEDYEYLCLLAQKVATAEGKGFNARDDKALAQAKKLLEVNDVASSMTGFTRDTEKIFSKREAIAKAIEEIGKWGQLPFSNKAETSVKMGAVPIFQVTEDFAKPISVGVGKTFGDYGQLTFELYRGGTFAKDDKTGALQEMSNSYRDSAIIRSTKPLPSTYKVSAVVGEVYYGLEEINGLEKDPEYDEGPQNENGCYLLVITDEAPTGHHTNDWWHQHRKVCIDIDNNIWGHGMPNPIFMVYFNSNNELVSFNGAANQWESKWINAVTYSPSSWYKVEIEKTQSEFIMRIYDDKGGLLEEGAVSLKEIWNEDGDHPDYLVIGDPHENYYQGSMKIKAISMPVGAE